MLFGVLLSVLQLDNTSCFWYKQILLNWEQLLLPTVRYNMGLKVDSGELNQVILGIWTTLDQVWTICGIIGSRCDQSVDFTHKVRIVRTILSNITLFTRRFRSFLSVIKVLLFSQSVNHFWDVWPLGATVPTHVIIQNGVRQTDSWQKNVKNTEKWNLKTDYWGKSWKWSVSGKRCTKRVMIAANC